MQHHDNFAKGTIALDIDGTITTSHHELPSRVQTFLEKLIEDGWQLIFITGRTFSFAYPVLSKIKGNFLFGVQNGSSLFQMPDNKLVIKNYLSKEEIVLFHAIAQEVGVSLLIESGKQNDDICYFNSKELTVDELEYLEFRKKISLRPWVDLPSFDLLPIAECAVIKYFSTDEKAKKFQEKMKKLPFNHLTIKDPFRPPFSLTLISQADATKDKMVGKLAKRPLIAAGDDFNDFEMIKLADVKITMADAPKELQEIADIVALGAKNEGIIAALEEAIKRV